MERWWYVGATVRVGWGGMGGLKTFNYTSTPTSCYATAGSSCFHTHVMLPYCRFLLHLHTHTHVMLRYCRFFLHFHTHTHVMLRYCRFFLHLHTHVMLRYCRFLLHLHAHTHTSCYATAGSSCTCTHTSCYATAGSSWTCTQSSRNVGVGWGGGANNVQVYFHTHVMLRYCTFLACGNTYASSSTDITRRTRPPRCSGWKTSFASFCSSGPWMMIHTKHCKYQVKCSILIDFSRVLRLTEEAC